MIKKTIIIRHRKENKKKCSLQPLVNRSDCLFLGYPDANYELSDHHVLLGFDGPRLSPDDWNKEIVLIDATWRRAETIYKQIFLNKKIPKRSLVTGIRTAYPRRQEDCLKPEVGLASVEALYVAYLMIGRCPSGLLDHYYWKEQFLEKNRAILENYSHFG